jgi:hypothetical protein
LLLGSAVGARAQFLVIPEQISFGTVTVGQSASNPVIAYRSFDDGTVVTATSDNPAFTISPSSQVVGTDGAQFTVRFAPTTGGSQFGTVSFSDINDGQVRVLGEVPVDGSGFAPFSVNPTSLTFDRTLVGSSISQTFRVLVASQSQGIDFTVQSSNPSVFSVNPTQFSNLQSGQPGVVVVTFNPNTAGPLRGAIRVNGGGGSISVEVDGEGAAFLLSAAQLDLGGALVGCSAARDLTITTGSLFDFQIVPTTQGLPFSVDPSTFTASMPSTVTARFIPVAGGPAQGIFRIFARVGSRIVQQQDLPVSGAGTEPVPSASSIDFGEVPAGTTSSTRSVNITPDPPASFQGSYSASSDNPAFRVLSTNTSGRVDVVFAPLSEGPASGIITIQVATQSNRGCTTPVQVAVSGIGTEALLTLAPSSINFGMQPVGQTSAAREVVITNESATPFAGTATSDNAAFRVNPASAAVVAQTAVSVPAGGSARLPIVFQPSAVGAVSGMITFEFQGTPAGSAEPISLMRTVSVEGEGAATNLSYLVVQAGTPAAVSPGGVVDFGPAGIGSTNSVELQIRNEGETPAPIDLISASDAPVFTAAGPQLPTTIAPGASLTLSLAFQPAAFSSYSGTLEVGSALFSLEGRGVLGGAEITGVADTVPAGAQSQVGVQLSGPAPQNLSGLLTMVYTPAGSLQPDPSVQFQTGGTSVPFTVAEGFRKAVFSGGDTVGFQSGTVASNFLFSASLEAGELDVTPSPAPSRSASVPGGPPTISRVTVEAVTASGFTVVVEGFSATREITQATFNLTGRSGIQVQPASITPSGIAAVFQNWYQSEASLAFGSMFTLTVPFTISGETNAIASVSATVSNAQGASQAMSANLP